ncbi:sensor histidine kinase [soil metagenome]
MIGKLKSWLTTASSFWQVNMLGWILFSVVAVGIRTFAQNDLWKAFCFTLFQTPIAIGLSAGLYFIYRRPRLSGSFRVRTAAWVIGLSLLAAILESAAAIWLVTVTGWTNPPWTPHDEWLLRIIFLWLVYMGWSLAFFWAKAELSTQLETQRAEHALGEAQRMELQLLRLQLDPHFLFNSLNGIAAEIAPHPAAATNMVRELAEYLRYSLDQRHRALVPLAVEIDAMTAYLRIEQARFGEQLMVELEVDERARREMVPSFLLQPLVENAVKHGLQTSRPPWKILIRASKPGTVLQLEVCNSGKIQSSSGSRVGLETLHRRLDLYYPDRHEFSLLEKDGLVRSGILLEGEPCFA